MDRPPINLPECYRIQDAVSKVRTLADMGIKGPDCRVNIIRYGESGSFPVRCVKFEGHTGDHETQ